MVKLFFNTIVLCTAFTVIFFIGIHIFSFFLPPVQDPFYYPLTLTYIPGNNQRVTLCFHGYGGNYTIAQQLKDLGCIDDTLVSFNFPDHDIGSEKYIKKQQEEIQVYFGSLKELLPALFVLKKLVVVQGIDTINIYGFSAGAGAVINSVKVLTKSCYDDELFRAIDMTPSDKKKILAALQRGIIMLDCPLKSIEEIIGLKGSNPELAHMQKQYRVNDMRPIDSLESFEEAPLNVILYFQHPDEVIGNSDDVLFVERLQHFNRHGKTQVIISHNGELHNGAHLELFERYRDIISGP